MKLLTDKGIHRFFAAILAACLLLLTAGMLFPRFIAADLEAQMLRHDSELAGYLLQEGVGRPELAQAFSSEKTEQTVSSGQEFLRALGIQPGGPAPLYAGTDALALKYRLIFLCLILAFSLAVFAAFFAFFIRRGKELDRADAAIRDFMAGSTAARLESEDEGRLSRLFASVNGMATALNAHIEAEKQTKDFLKRTMEDISHQLKTPLASLRMCNDIIRSDSGDEAAVRRFSEKAAEALEHMEALVQSLLKISRFDAGVIVLNKTVQNLGDLLRETVSGFEIRMEREHKSVLLEGGEDTVLNCDRGWMTEAVGNLIKNALDHMDAGGQIRISWKETPVITEIAVQDNGTGIHPEDIHHIFKRFYRCRFSQNTQGIGLGLSLTKLIVEAHGGTVTVNSTLGEGSTFLLDFLKLTNL